MKQMRRIIAAVNEVGESVFVADEIVAAKSPPLLAGNQLLELFGVDRVTTVPTTGDSGAGLPYFPATGGIRFGVFTVPPVSRRLPVDDPENALIETEQQIPGITDAFADETGLHSTPTYDLEYVIAGEFALTLKSGEKKIVHAGDAVVHCGEVHAWENESDDDATMLVVFVGAETTAPH